MQFIPVKTRAFLPPRDDLFALLDDFLPRSGPRRLRDSDIVFITSKILAIHQGRCVPVKGANKNKLIEAEAQAYIKPQRGAKHEFYLTVKDFTLIPSAGIDESNGKDYYILWPRNTVALLKKVHRHLRRRHKIKKLAVVATDSHTIPMRYGVIGISTGFYGIEPVYDYRGKKDIFGRTLKYTRANIVDSLAAMAVLKMGEGSERTPLLVARGIPGIKFTNHATYKKLVIPPAQDLYKPLFKSFKKGHG